VLSQRRDPERFPELTYLASQFELITSFQKWRFGHDNAARLPQGTDLPSDFLLPDASNLGLVLHDLMQRSATRTQLLEHLSRFYESAQFISTKIQGGTVQLFIEERGGALIPATRLSDGTIRYLSLIAILCHPSPPPLICIEEPELGLHPDVILIIAELLKDASQRTQLVITTHSDALVSALSDVPESVVVCESGPDGTSLRRLDREQMAAWLETYSLGEVWRMGEIGGNRW
jgi:predicted ATPase